MATLLNRTVEGIAKSNFSQVGQSYTATGTIVSLENPFTKEYRVLIGGVQVVAYGISDQVFEPNTSVVILRSTLDSQSDHFILRASADTGATVVPVLDEYDQIGKPISVTVNATDFTAANTLLEQYIEMADNPYICIGATLTLGGDSIASGDFVSELTVTFNDAKTLVYSTSHMEGVLTTETTAQKSAYLKVPSGAKTIAAITQEDKGCTGTWSALTITVYNKSSQETACRLIAEEGFELPEDAETTDTLSLRVKMRDNFKTVTPVEVKWFRENPLIYGPADQGYDEEAGIGWERFDPYSQQENKL